MSLVRSHPWDTLNLSVSSFPCSSQYTSKDCGLILLATLGVKTQISPWPGLCALDPCSFDCGCSCPVGVVDWSGLLPCCIARRGHHLRASQVAHCLGQWRLLALMISPCHWYLVRRRLVLTAARAKKQVVRAESCCVKSTLAAFGTYLFFFLFGPAGPRISTPWGRGFGCVLPALFVKPAGDEQRM